MYQQWRKKMKFRSRLKNCHQWQYNITLYSAAIERQSWNLSQITLTYGMVFGFWKKIKNFKRVLVYFYFKSRNRSKYTFSTHYTVFQIRHLQIKANKCQNLQSPKKSSTWKSHRQSDFPLYFPSQIEGNLLPVPKRYLLSSC